MNTLTKRPAEPIELSGEEFAPRDERNRFRIYDLAPCAECKGQNRRETRSGVVVGCDNCRGRGHVLRLLATTPTSEGIGTFIVTHAADALDGGGAYEAPGPLGVLDSVESRWVMIPWSKGGTS
jgi:hypothetical protein